MTEKYLVHLKYQTPDGTLHEKEFGYSTPEGGLFAWRTILGDNKIVEGTVTNTETGRILDRFDTDSLNKHIQQQMQKCGYDPGNKTQDFLGEINARDTHMAYATDEEIHQNEGNSMRQQIADGATTVLEAQDICPWAGFFIDVEGGILCFESYTDYHTAVFTCDPLETDSGKESDGGYRVHIEGEDKDPEYCATLRDAKEYLCSLHTGYHTWEEIVAIAYIVTEEEYLEEKNQ